MEKIRFLLMLDKIGVLVFSGKCTIEQAGSWLTQWATSENYSNCDPRNYDLMKSEDRLYIIPKSNSEPIRFFKA